jgi:hypothetical protein
MVVVMREGHRWAEREYVSFRELAHEPCLLFRREQSPYMHDLIHSSAQSAGVQLTVVDEVDDAAATEVAVTTEPVVAFASAARRKEIEGLVSVPLVDPTPVLTSYVVWPKQPKPVVSTFLQALESVAFPAEHPSAG